MSLWSAGLDALFPPACAACGRGGPSDFCAACLAAIPRPAEPLCPSCGLPTPTATGVPCTPCRRRPPAFRRARACATYGAAGRGAPLESVLHRFKYERDLSQRDALAALVTDRCPFDLRDYDVIVPVPLHLSRLRWRGFNQAQHLALPLARRAALTVDPFLLERVRATTPQVGLDARSRRRNVRGAFRVARPGPVAGRRVLLVDDVYTSGATADACARELVGAQAEVVDVLVLAHAALG